MDLHVTGHHVEITPALRDYVSSRLRRIAHRFDHVAEVSVVLSVEKLVHRGEATLRIGGKKIFCEHAGTDLYGAIDGLADKLGRALVRNKEKSLERRQRGAR